MNKAPLNKKNTTKKIYNPITNTYYQVRVKNTPAGKKGTIIGTWSPKKK